MSDAGPHGHCVDDIMTQAARAEQLERSIRKADERERRAKYDREHPIYGTDLSRPLPDIIESLRHDITQIRGSLGDIGRAFPGWAERVESVEGLLTCGLIALFYVREEMLKVYSEQSPPSPKGLE